MTFDEARTELHKRAGTRYHAIQYNETFYARVDTNTSLKVECAIYIDGDNWSIGNTWEEVFAQHDNPGGTLHPEQAPD